MGAKPARPNLDEARDHAGDESKMGADEPEEAVADEGYHSKCVMLSLLWAGLANIHRGSLDAVARGGKVSAMSVMPCTPSPP